MVSVSVNYTVTKREGKAYDTLCENGKSPGSSKKRRSFYTGKHDEERLLGIEPSRDVSFSTGKIAFLKNEIMLKYAM